MIPALASGVQQTGQPNAVPGAVVTGTCSATYSTATCGTSPGSARNVPSIRTVPH